MNCIEVNACDLTGRALDLAVAMSEGATNLYYDTVSCWWFTLNGVDRVLSSGWSAAQNYCPSTDWNYGGPLIGRELISFSEVCSREKDGRNVTSWLATCRPIHQFQNYTSRNSVFSGEGPTHLIAAMRCYVASRLGDRVSIPKELLQ